MDIVVTILTAILTSSVVTAILEWFIKVRVEREQRKWEVKREACLEALEIIDVRFADYPWQTNGKLVKVDGQGFVPTARIRSCFNRLAISCNNSKVPEEFSRCLNLKLDAQGTGSLNLTAITDLRNAIRNELGFGHRLPTSLAWIFYISWRRGKKKTTK